MAGPGCTVRPARFTDLPALNALFRDMFARSRYSATTTLCDRTVKAVLINAVRDHGRGRCLFVAEPGGRSGDGGKNNARDTGVAGDAGDTGNAGNAGNAGNVGKPGAPYGFIIGACQPVYGVCKAREASDEFFYVADRAHPLAAPRLLAAFDAWARRAPGVTAIRLGITGAVSDWRRVQKLYVRRGYRQDGVFMIKEIEP